MDTQLLCEKAAALRNRLNDPNLCFECWQIHESLYPVTRFATFANGASAKCTFLICEGCYPKGAPHCREMLELVCKYIDPDNADDEEPRTEDWLTEEFAKEIVLRTHYHEEYMRALAGKGIA